MSSSRIEELELLVSQLRHDMRGAVTTATLIAERLETHSDLKVQRAARRIATAAQRVVEIVDAAYEQVPQRDSTGHVLRESPQSLQREG